VAGGGGGGLRGSHAMNAAADDDYVVAKAHAPGFIARMAALSSRTAMVSM
jgi:hypothetical protein